MPYQVHQYRASSERTYPYLLYVPDAYLYNCVDRYPFILFLHGSGERGTDPELIKNHALPRLLVSRTDFPFVVAAPQCPPETRWTDHLGALRGLIDELTTTLLIDSKRSYLSGISMGGQGVWAFAAANPGRFAAIAPICGRIPPEPDFLDQVCALKDIPAWVFHGAQDTVVPVENSEKIVAALRDCGGQPKLTIYPEADHHSWDLAYAEPELFPWLLAQRRA